MDCGFKVIEKKVAESKNILKNNVVKLEPKKEVKRPDKERTVTIPGKIGILKKLFKNKPMINAAKGGNAEKVKLLLEKGADVDAKDNSGNTALIYAAVNGHIETVKILVEKGADVNAEDKDGLTALFWAYKKGYPDIELFLIDKGAIVNARHSEIRGFSYADFIWGKIRPKYITGYEGGGGPLIASGEFQAEFIHRIIRLSKSDRKRLKSYFLQNVDDEEKLRKVFQEMGFDYNTPLTVIKSLIHLI